jgi:hypothetical protein
MIRKLLAAAFLFVAPNAFGQGATPAPLSKVTVSAEVAKRTLMKMQINADTAKAIADSCVEFSKTSTPPQSISIFILGPTGDIVHAHVMDGVLFPHHLSRSIDGKPNEEMTFKTIKINPAFKADTFTAR